jgi:hypothetical protein
MAPEGMVHALEIIHQLLAPNGLLIDIHPTSEPPPILVHTDEGDYPAGWLQETDDFTEYEQADQALQQAIRQQWFVLEDSDEFLFTIHAGALDELIAYLSVEWKDAVIMPETAAKIESLFHEHPGKKHIIITEKISIARYRRTG